MDPATTAVIYYLEQRAEVDRVHMKDKSTCSADALAAWEEKNECELPEDLKKFYTMSDGLEIRWSCKTGTNNVLPIFIGKIYINSLMDLTKITSLGSKTAIVDELNDFAENDSPRFNSHGWHIFELDPCDGQGRVCLVYNAHHDVSIWFLDRSLQFHRLASTFTDYYRLLLLHCGLPYWYYKYTDIGIPPYILHWYYIITPSLLISHPNDDLSSSNLIPFNAEKVFQRNTTSTSKNPKALNQQNSTGQTQPPYPVAGIRSATQNQKRPIQQTKSVNRSSSVPRSMNN
jgi:tubulin polyglutamylase complex subunit 2